MDLQADDELILELKIKDFKTKFEMRNLFLTLEVMNFLSDWLKNHIMGPDKKYAGFLNEKGLK